MAAEYPRECRLAVELIARLGKPLDITLLLQNELLRIGAAKFALNYHGTNPFAHKMKHRMGRPPRSITLKQALAIVRIMKDELEDS